MSDITIEALEEKCESMYKLVIAAAKRAGQVSKPESRPLVSTTHRKPTLVALEEIVQGKVLIKDAEEADDVVE
jgi:DNA-directed RNA polymerase omega subunit